VKKFELPLNRLTHANVSTKCALICKLMMSGRRTCWENASIMILFYISCVSSSCFHQLRQLRRIRRSLDKESAATLVHAFVTSRVDYCNAVFVAAPKTATDKLQRVLNAAARLISDTRKYDQGLSRLMHQDLHWLDIPERVRNKTLSTDTSMSPREGSSVPVRLLHSAHLYPKLLHDSTCVQPLVTGWWFRDIGSARTAVGHLLSLAR